MYDTWSNCVLITVNSSTGLSDFQTKVEFQGHDSGADNYINPWSFIAGGDDLRLTNEGETADIPYWIESWDDVAETAVIWIKSSLINGNTKIHMFWGKTGESSVSDGDDTFEFFDDFLGTTLDLAKWTVDANVVYSVGGGILSVTDVDASWGVWKGIHASISNVQGVRIEADGVNWIHAGSDLLGWGISLDDQATTGKNLGMHIADAHSTINEGYLYFYSDGATLSKGNIEGQQPVDLVAQRDQSGNCKFFKDDVEQQVGTETSTNSFDTVMLRVNRLSGYVYPTTEVSRVLVRKYNDPEPTTSVGGTCNDASKDLQVEYTVGDIVGIDIQVPYYIFELVSLSSQNEADIASSERLQLLQIQVHTESTDDVISDAQSIFNIDGYVSSDIQRKWTIGGSGLDLGQIYNILNIGPPIDVQSPYCVEGYVHCDAVRSYNIRFPGGYYAKPPIELNAAARIPWAVTDLDRKYHNWKVWETEYAFNWKSSELNTEVIEGRAITGSVQGDFIRLTSETLEAYYRAECWFYSDDDPNNGFDMFGKYEAVVPTGEGGWSTIWVPKGTHEESQSGHKLRLVIDFDLPFYMPRFQPSDAETGWKYIFNRGGHLRSQYDETDSGHGFYKVDMLVSGNLDTDLDFEIAMDDEVQYTLRNMESLGLGFVAQSITDCCCDEGCWDCCDDHTHWIVWSWQSDMVAKKFKYNVRSISSDTGYRSSFITIWGSTDSWTGDPDTMNWQKLGSGGKSANWNTKSGEYTKTIPLKTLKDCKYFITDIKASYRYYDEDEEKVMRDDCINNVNSLEFFKMMPIEVIAPCLDAAKFRVVPGAPYAMDRPRWLELADIFITRYHDKGYKQQNVWTHFPALYEWKYLELFKWIYHESTTIYARLKLWQPSVETDWFGEYGASEAVFYKSSNITPPSGFESAEWVRWKTWLRSTGAYTPEFHWLSVHSECHDVPMDDLDLLGGVTWDEEAAAGTMAYNSIPISAGPFENSCLVLPDKSVIELSIDGATRAESVEALVRPAVWLRPDWLAIEIPVNMSWSESIVGKVWSGYCIDQNDAHITSAEGGYLTLISERGNTNLNLVNTSCMVTVDGFFQVFMKGDYEDWEFTMQRVTSDRMFDPGYRQYPSGSSVEFEDVTGSHDLKFWVIQPEDICPKSIAHLDSLATY